MALSRINTNQIVDGAVATADIADGLITTAKLADGAVTTAKITDGNISTAKLADDAVTTAKVNPSQTDITSVGTLTGLNIRNSSSTGPSLNIGTTSTSVADGGFIGGILFDAGSSNTACARIQALSNGTDEGGADFSFECRESGASFIEKMRILGSGHVGIGVTDPTEFNSYGNGLVINKSSQSGSAGISLISATNGYGSIYFNDGTGNNTIAKIEYFHTNNEFKTATNGQVKHKIQENGTHVFTMKDTDGGTNTAIWGSGTNSYIQGVSGEIYARDSAGNNTLLSPHRFEYIPDGASEEGAWAYLSKKSDSNIKTEKDEDGNDVSIVDTTEAKDFTYVNVDMMKVVREVEKLTGTKLVYTGNQDGDDGSTVKDNIIQDLIKRIETLEGS